MSKEFTDQQKKDFLIGITREFYDQGDSYSACKTKKGHWQFWYSNDYPMQHGDGSVMQLPDKIVSILMNKMEEKK